MACAPTTRVVTVKVAVVEPSRTVTLPGTVAAAVFELVKVTTAPPAGAGFVSVTVAVEGVPPGTLAGETATEDSAAGAVVTVRDAVFVSPP